MARRKKTRRTTTRRRRVSGFGSNDLQVVLGAALGALGTAFANSQVAKMTKPIDPKMLAGIQVLVGGALGVKAKSPLLKGIGYGVVAAGASSAAKSFGLISGFYNLQAINGLKRMSGLADRKNIMGGTVRNDGRTIRGANSIPGITQRNMANNVINGIVTVNGHADGSAT